MAADLAELVAIVQAIGEELYKRTTKRLEGRPQLKLVIAVLGISICLLIAGRTAAWIFSTPTGTSLGRVSGTVFLDGEPVSGATVEFTPHQGSTAYGITNSKGYYTLQYLPDCPGAVTGQNTVRITTYDWRTTKEGNKIEIPEKLPERYNRHSTLMADVTSGSQTLDWKLTSH